MWAKLLPILLAERHTDALLPRWMKEITTRVPTGAAVIWIALHVDALAVAEHLADWTLALTRARVANLARWTWI
jgi:hypothetical protein